MLCGSAAESTAFSSSILPHTSLTCCPEGLEPRRDGSRPLTGLEGIRAGECREINPERSRKLLKGFEQRKINKSNTETKDGR